MVGVVTAVASVYLLQEVAQFLLVQLVVPDEPCLFVQVEGEHGQRSAWGRFGKCKYVKVPVVLRILSHGQAVLE